MLHKILRSLNHFLSGHTPFVLTRAPKAFGSHVEQYFDVFEKLDYVRMMGFNLIANEIRSKELDGNVAELGVYKGKFARYINQAFPEKKLFLFDTFEGFSEKDFTTKEESEIVSKVLNDFNNTSVEEVLSNMPFRDKCVIKKGLFPATTEGCEGEQFCFVSIDADLYKPIYDGLEFFYGKLVKGGYLMVHDYNNQEYKGAKLAVRDFSKKFEIPFVPIADGWGSVVFCK